jgi:hypothetical protein
MMRFHDWWLPFVESDRKSSAAQQQISVVRIKPYIRLDVSLPNFREGEKFKECIRYRQGSLS